MFTLVAPTVSETKITTASPQTGTDLSAQIAAAQKAAADAQAAADKAAADAKAAAEADAKAAADAAAAKAAADAKAIADAEANKAKVLELARQATIMAETQRLAD